MFYKPRFLAKRMIKKRREPCLRGFLVKPIKLLRAFVLLIINKNVKIYVISQVKFRALSHEEIRAYVSLGESFDKAGAYAVQGAGAGLVDSIQGSVTNIIGLPVAEVLHEAKLMLCR